jgi:EpsI family protein
VKPRTALVAVCAVMAAAAAISYAVGDPASRLTGTVRLSRPLNDAIPRELGDWRGVDDPMSDEVVRTTKVDDYVRRRYRSRDGAELLLYVAYHGNKERGMQTYYHNATICFPSQGWRLESERTGTETLHDAAKEVPVCRYVFSKDAMRISAMTFFKVDGDLLDQSPRNKPFWMLLDRATPQLDDSPGTFVQVQLLTTVGAGGESGAADVQSRFLRDFGRTILTAVESGLPE